jgi:hypothetical protein
VTRSLCTVASQDGDRWPCTMRACLYQWLAGDSHCFPHLSGVSFHRFSPAVCTSHSIGQIAAVGARTRLGGGSVSLFPCDLGRSSPVRLRESLQVSAMVLASMGGGHCDQLRDDRDALNCGCVGGNGGKPALRNSLPRWKVYSWQRSKGLGESGPAPSVRFFYFEHYGYGRTPFPDAIEYVTKAQHGTVFHFSSPEQFGEAIQKMAMQLRQVPNIESATTLK